MTIVSQIITDAYRESNLIAVGAAPKAAEVIEGLRRLQSLVSSACGSEVGELFRQWPLGNFGRTPQTYENFTPQMMDNPPINSRLIVTNDIARTVNLPTNPSPGSRMAIIDPFARLAAFPVTINGNGRVIETAATLLLNTNSLNRTWFYRDDIGVWTRVTDLAEGIEMPFPPEFDDYFVTKLAMRVNPRYGKKLAAETVERLKEQRREIQNRYLQSAPLEVSPDISFTSRMTFENWNDTWLGGDTQNWNRGSWY